ncbi:MAG: aspartate--tRNA ligase [bacterium]|nr:aspartate--tRNA ligase [bacterium]MDZ4285771.1 aspartate--tRNA ligase [Candidatus Sungbacteria bacterium]
MRTLTKDTPHKIGETVTLKGWVHGRRDHGKLIFIDLRDRWGMVQVVFTPADKELLAIANHLRSEWVIKLQGLVKERPQGMQNQEIPTGAIEIEAKGLEILSEAQTPPFAIDTDGRDIGEEHRLEYRYLDLRRERMQKNLILRDKVISFIRNFLHDKDFLEIETPILTKSTPEGARDYVVPSRVYPGSFYALPQSPQQYKQLLMVAGMERYFQIARCFRDEDTRGDRQPEFTQLDVEMSFVEREDILTLIEDLLIHLIRTVAPEKKIQAIPFPRMTYKEAMEKHGTDKPDLRTNKDDSNELAFCWVLDFPVFEKGEQPGTWTYSHNPFTAPKPEFLGNLLAGENLESIISQQYDIALNGYEIGGGGIRIFSAETLKKVFSILGHSNEQIQEQFGHMFHALTSGAPPHGGIAWGLDRLIMLLAEEPNIREVIAFPKTGDARDLMMKSPAEIPAKHTDELGLKIVKK